MEHWKNYGRILLNIMTSEQILKLVEAGYTKADIEAMNATSAPAPAETPEETEETAAQPAAQEEPAAAQSDPAQPVDPMRAIMDALARLSNQIAVNNINTNMQPEQPARTAEQALAEIIAPPIPAKRKF